MTSKKNKKETYVQEREVTDWSYLWMTFIGGILFFLGFSAGNKFVELYGIETNIITYAIVSLSVIGFLLIIVSLDSLFIEKKTIEETVKLEKKEERKNAR